mmetsp:Transcript_7460/g.14120  ORF Transcript_7460/g.14120 Transcript_7460/m.14120 type:complete len:578 (+) Transcript_7460:116-1849(+)
MTRAACDFILRVSTFGLVWRSMKDLKRITEAHAATEKSDNDNNNHRHDDTPSLAEEFIEIQDWEILQLWALYAFHVLYIYSGLEWVVSFLPLYYYIKLILLVITFLIPNTKFANFWFELLLVPMMQRTHEILNLDWKAMIYHEMILLPWQILDLFLLPGLMISDEEAARVLTLRHYQLEQGSIKNNHVLLVEQEEIVTTIITTTMDDTTKKDDGTVQRTNATTATAIATATATAEHEHTPHRLVLPKSPPSTTTPTATTTTTPTATTPTTTSTSKSSSFTSPIARSRVAVSSLHLQKFSRDHNVSNNTFIASRTRSKTTTTTTTTQLPPSPERQQPQELRSQQQRQMATATTNPQSKSIKKPPMVAFKQTKASILLSQSVSPRNTYSSSYYNASNDNRDKSKSPQKISLQKSTGRRIGPKPESSIFRRTSLSSHSQQQQHRQRQQSESKQSALFYDNHDDDDLISTTTTTTSRKSMGQSVRKFITGDDNIRIRDFLFDLELPSMPSPMRRPCDVDHHEDGKNGKRHGAATSPPPPPPTSTTEKKRKNLLMEQRRQNLEDWKKERKGQKAGRSKIRKD